VEDLPDADEWARRREAGAGMIRPELAVVLAYAKEELIQAIEASGLAAVPALRRAVGPYFAPALQERFGDLIPRHRLFPQLVATDLAGEIVDRMSIIWAHETADELGKPLADVAGAFWAAREVLDTSGIWNEVETVGNAGSADADAAMHATLADAVGDLARRYLLRGDTALTGIIEQDAPLVAPLISPVGQSPAWSGPQEALDARAGELVDLGVPTELALALSARHRLAPVGDAAAISRFTGRSLADALLALEALFEVTGGSKVGEALITRHSASRWEAWAKRSVLDDLADWRLEAAKAALTVAPDSAPAEAVAAWVAERTEGLARATRLLDRLDGGRDALAVASLAVRNLRVVH
jgi:glutamate dehydrogenase